MYSEFKCFKAITGRNDQYQRLAGCCDEEIYSRYQYQLKFYNPDTGARNGAFFICGVNMAVQISGVLKDGAGKTNTELHYSTEGKA